MSSSTETTSTDTSSTGSVALRPVDPPADAVLLHGWVTAERAAFWGMQGLDVAEVAEIYGYIDAQDHLAAHLMLLDGHPVGLLQTYDPFVDEIGEFYDRRPGDIGVHLLLSDDPSRARRTPELIAAGLRFVLDRPGVERLVLEPDADNAASLALLARLGAERGPRVELRTSVVEKTAQFHFLTRARAAALM